MFLSGKGAHSSNKQVILFSSKAAITNLLND